MKTGKKISVGKKMQKNKCDINKIYVGSHIFLCEMNLNNGHNNIPPKATVVSSLKV